MKHDEMARGYLDGLNSGSAGLPACHNHEPAAYKHGWLNGRDDRLGKPRDRCEVLRRRAAMCLNTEASTHAAR